MLSTDIQNIIVYAIGIATAIYIILRIYKVITGRRNPCASCAKDCALRDDLKKTCRTNNKKGNGNCCC